MARQSRLVLLLLFCLGISHIANSSTAQSAPPPPPTPPTPSSPHAEAGSNEFNSEENYIDDSLEKLNYNEKAVKISSPKMKTLETKTTTAAAVATAEKVKRPMGTAQPVSDEILKNLIEASKHSVALAEDPRFNKMLPDRLKAENATTSKNNSEYNYDDYNYDDSEEYEDYGNEDQTATTTTTTTAPTATNAKSKKVKVSVTAAKPQPHDADLKQSKMKNKNEENDSGKTNDIDNDDEYLDDDDIYEDNDDDEDGTEDDIADEEEIVFSENVPCPRYCACARNINSYMVATCSRLDPGTQKFGLDITDIVVTDVGPKYPILLGPKFFQQLGLKHVATIKIANCTIEYMHPEAFHGLDELYAVNLTNVGLAIISPDTFAQNKKLRMLTITGNDLSVMSSVHYLLKSASLEELDLSRNNLMELNPNAFTKLSNIVYINLSHNNLQKIPPKVLDPVETIEELDLSYNSLKDLPAGIFNRTALAILHLKYNSFTGDLSFGTSDLQQLDLSFNSISQVHHGMFDKMSGLTNLNLKGNGITKIQPDSFLTLKNLRHIDLSINELDQISSMLFFKNSELDVIRLNDNPRLSQLPTDGFLSYNGYFTVYYMDISNCALNPLGHKTFSTMPHLTTLKLAWNNINNLEPDTFASLTKLIDLDLSNNLISKLDEFLFMENNELTKLNLAGNPIRKLSVRLFLPMNKLRELDVSDCELTSLLSDKQFGEGYKFFETLRSFNASANQIKKISTADIKNFKNLHSLDIMHNPLKCNSEFLDFIEYASMQKHMLPKKMPALANLDESVSFYDYEAQKRWTQLAHDICKHNEELNKDIKLQTRIEEADKELDEDAKDLLNIMGKSKLSKMQKILKDSQKTETIKDDHRTDGLMEEEQLNHRAEPIGDVDDNDEQNDEYEDEDDEDNDEEDDDDGDDNAEDDQPQNDKNRIIDDFDKFERKHLEKIKNYGIKVEEVSLPQGTNGPYLLHKLYGGSGNEDDEEVIIERGHIYYTNYNYLVPTIIVVICLVLILLAIVRVVTIVLRKRGERYRMALLATKNSIVYQKLTEDIVKPTAKEAKFPKVHRYAPINQV